MGGTNAAAQVRRDIPAGPLDPNFGLPHGNDPSKQESEHLVAHCPPTHGSPSHSPAPAALVPNPCPHARPPARRPAARPVPRPELARRPTPATDPVALRDRWSLRKARWVTSQAPRVPRPPLPPTHRPWLRRARGGARPALRYGRNGSGDEVSIVRAWRAKSDAMRGVRESVQHVRGWAPPEAQGGKIHQY